MKASWARRGAAHARATRPAARLYRPGPGLLRARRTAASLCRGRSWTHSRIGWWRLRGSKCRDGRGRQRHRRRRTPIASRRVRPLRRWPRWLRRSPAVAAPAGRSYPHGTVGSAVSPSRASPHRREQPARTTGHRHRSRSGRNARGARYPARCGKSGRTPDRWRHDLDASRRRA